jgi:outer membrane lipoprotein-sorting protein
MLITPSHTVARCGGSLRAVFVAIIALTALAVGAQRAALAQALPTSQAAIIMQAEAYLNALTTLRADFIQISSAAPPSRGVFSLSRPGRMRIDYQEPSQDFIVADGAFIYFWDAAISEQQNAPIGGTLADFLLRDKIVLSGDVKVTDVRAEGGLLEITVIQAKDPGLGSLTLIFERQPFALRQWRVFDAQGQTTEVTLQNARFGIALDPQQFYFRNPQRLSRDKD